MEFVNPLSNWWQLNKKVQYEDKNYTEILSYDELVSAIQFQIQKVLKPGKDKEIFNTNYYLTDIKIVLEPHQYDQMIQTSQNITNEYLPLLTFHSTDNINKVNSICRYGYLMPGQIHPDSGYPVGMSHGKYYGTGIYSSTEFQTNQWYTFLDQNKSIQVIVNLQLPGLVHDITKHDIDKNSYSYPVTIDHLKDYASYNNGTHSRTPDRKIWITASGKYIIPCAIVTLQPNQKSKYMKTYFQPQVNGSLYDLSFPYQHVSKSEPTIHFHKVFEDYYIMNTQPKTNDLILKSMPVYIQAQKVQTIEKDLYVPSKHLRQYHIVIPVYKNFKNHQKTFNNFINSLQTNGQCYVYFYGGYPEKHLINNDNFNSLINSYERHKKGDIIQALELVFSSIYSQKETDKIINTLYLFVDRSIKDITPKTNQLMTQYWRDSPHVLLWVKNIYMNSEISTETQLGINYIKFHVGIETTWDNFSQYVTKLNSLVQIMDEFIQQDNLLTDTNHLDVKRASVPYPLGIIGEGFLVNIYDQANWDAVTTQYLLYKGSNLPIVKLNNRYYNTFWHNDDIVDEDYVIKFSEIIIHKLYSFRNYAMIYPHRIKHFSPVITALCEKLLHVLSCISTVSIVKTYKYAVTSMFNEIKRFAKLEFSGKWFDQLTHLTFVQSILKRTKLTKTHTPKEVMEWIDPKYKKYIKDASDALGYYNRTGVAIKTRTSDACEIEPWLLIVDYISPDTVTISDMFRQAELGEANKTDSTGEYINNLIPCSCTNLLDKMYISYLFTGNPYIDIAGQYTSLVTNTWTTLVYNIVFTSGHRSRSQFNIMMELYGRVTELFAKETDSLQNIIKYENFECYLTEKYGIPSVPKLLGLLTQNDASEIIFSQKYNRFCFAVLAECITRSCRAYMRTEKKTVNSIINHVIGLKNTSDLTIWKLNLDKASARTGEFYKGKWTNCSPQTAVACLEFLEMFHKGIPREDIFIQLAQISMGRFLDRHLPKQNKYAVQLALFLQGIKYHKAHMRQNLNFSDAQLIIDEIVREQVQMVAAEQQLKKKMDTNRDKRLFERLNHAQIYSKYHADLPKTFTSVQVQELNKNRDANDQLELMPNGLLRHHCCFVTCPYYLVNLQSHKDSLGLRRHLEPDRTLGTYVKSLHITAQQYGHNILPTFMQKMNLHFHDNVAYSKTITTELLTQLWTLYH